MPQKVDIHPFILAPMIEDRERGFSWKALREKYDIHQDVISRHIIEARPDLRYRDNIPCRKAGTGTASMAGSHHSLDTRVERWERKTQHRDLPATGSDFIRPLTREELCGSGRRKTVSAPLECL